MSLTTNSILTEAKHKYSMKLPERFLFNFWMSGCDIMDRTITTPFTSNLHEEC